MTLTRILQASSAWLRAPDVLPRLQRLSILYGALYLALILVLTLVASDLNYGSSGVVGGDFLAFYTAGDMTLQGRSLEAYDFAAFDAALQTQVENEHLGMMWQYPPLMFFFVGLLALMPYKVALWVWIAGTMAIFVTALLMLAAFRPKRDWLVAGLAAGLLTIKPQLGVLLPLAYLLAGAWRAFGVAAISAVILHGISIAVFGPDSIEAFFNAVVRLQSDVAGSGTHTPPENMTTLFGQLRYWQVPSAIAMPFHILLSLVVLVSVCLCWRRFAGHEDRALYLASVTGAGAILVTPYAYAYEMAALAPAALWLAFASPRFRSAAVLLLTAASSLLIVRQFLPLEVLIQMPFLVSLSAFGLLLLDGNRAAKAQTPAA